MIDAGWNSHPRALPSAHDGRRPPLAPHDAAMIAGVAQTLAEFGVRKVAALDRPDAIVHIGVSRCDPRVIVLRRVPKPAGPYADEYVVIEDEAVGGNDAIIAALDPRIGPRFDSLRDLAAHLAWLAGDVAERPRAAPRAPSVIDAEAIHA